MELNDIDTLLSELSGYTSPQHTRGPVVDVIEVTDENINDYILKRTSALVDIGAKAVSELAEIVTQGQNPEEIASLAELISANTHTIEVLNKINLNRKKEKHAIEMKKMDIEGKKEIVNLIPGNVVNNNTNVLIASREEIMKQLCSGRSAIFSDEPLELEDIQEEKEEENHK